MSQFKCVRMFLWVCRFCSYLRTNSKIWKHWWMSNYSLKQNFLRKFDDFLSAGRQTNVMVQTYSSLPKSWLNSFVRETQFSEAHWNLVHKCELKIYSAVCCCVVMNNMMYFTPKIFTALLPFCRWPEGRRRKSNSKYNVCMKSRRSVKGIHCNRLFLLLSQDRWKFVWLLRMKLFCLNFSVRNQTSTLSHSWSRTCPKDCTMPTTGVLKTFTCWWRGSGMSPGTVPS